MKIYEIARKMCQTELTSADIRAICKTRGFSISDTKSPDLLESLLLSDVGLESVLAELDHKEILMLHFLKSRKKPVDVSAFERLTGKRSQWASTFNQRYGDTFKHVKNRLIRKGVLVFSTNLSASHKKTKLEKQVFGFPTEFHEHLPSPFTAPVVLPGKGERNEPFIRNKLHKLTQPVGSDEKGPYALGLNDGVLWMGDGEFNSDIFRKWLYRQWEMTKKPSLSYEGHSGAYSSPMAAMKYAFSTLKPDEWIDPFELEPIFQIFCQDGAKLNARLICRHGWETACLARQKKDGKTWYRTSPPFPEIFADSQFGDYLHVEDQGTILVNLKTIPMNCLETISRISRFRIQKGCLIASPDFIRIGKIVNEVGDVPLVKWLNKVSKGFSHAIKTASDRRGRQLIHKNLIIAKVKNIALKVNLEKSLKDGNLLTLPNDFIAFPESARNRVEAIVTQNGFAVKTIDPSSKKA